MECGAKKRDGSRCRAPAMPNGKCRIHGGKSLKGIASPSLKTAKHSRYLPKNLQAAYQAALEDTELLAARHDIALMDAMVMDLLGKLDKGESGKSWELMRKAIDGFEVAFIHEDYALCTTMIRQMRDIVDKKVAHYATQEEIQSLVDQRRKLVESERKRMIEMEQVVTSEQAMVLVGALLDSVRRNVTDRNALTAIQADFIHFTTFQDSQRISAGNDSESG